MNKLLMNNALVYSYPSLSVHQRTRPIVHHDQRNSGCIKGTNAPTSFFFFSPAHCKALEEKKEITEINFLSKRNNISVTSTPSFSAQLRNYTYRYVPKSNLYTNKMTGFNFFRRSSSKASSPKPATLQRTSLELFEAAVGDGASPHSYDFPALEVLEFDEKPYDSFEDLDEHQTLAITTTNEFMPPASPSPYEFNIDDEEAELRAEIELFSGPWNVDDKFRETLFDYSVGEEESC